MAINFTDSPANGATQVIDGRTYTYNSAKNKWDTTATEVTGPTATVYANVDALPTSGNITGAQAYVSGNNRLYIWNGTGWYNIALINTAPSISGVNSSYALAIDGTATTVTITATDPEGIPITYSIASDTSGNIATVAQSENVFTITPSTDSANAGTFSLTFRASDGVNIATSVSEFTLVFNVTNTNYTTALITTSGSTGGNSTITDSSSSSHSITVGGNTAQQSFSPYRSGGYSTYFDGTGDYLTAAADTSFDFGSGDFTVEFWTYPTTIPSGEGGLVTLYEYGSDRRSWYVAFDGSKLELRLSTSGTSADTIINSATGVFSANNWYHVAMVREGNNITGYVNGVSVATDTHSGAVYSNSTDPVIVGSVGTTLGGAEYEGYITDLRVVKGTAVYTADFTPPTERLTAITNTSLLACHLPYLADGSTNNHTLTPNGNVSTKPFAPYDYSEYAVGDHGGSIYFDGSGDFLEVPHSSDLNLGPSTTIQFWLYIGDGTETNAGIIGKWESAGTGNRQYILFKSGASINLYWSTDGSASAYSTLTTFTNIKNKWSHFAITYDNTTLKVYLNGKQVTTQTVSIASSPSDSTNIGRNGEGNTGYIEGYISDLKISTEIVYTTDFTPPTSPLSLDTNTKLLLKGQGAVIIDKAQGSTQLVGNTTASTAQYKYSTSSVYFDGGGDYIILDPEVANFGTGDFTIEMWLYPTESSNAIFRKTTSTGSASPPSVSVYVSGTTPLVGVNSGSADGTWITASSSFTNNAWNHFAITRESGAVKIWIDGSSAGSATRNVNVSNTTTFRLGQWRSSSEDYKGYIEDFRITKGLARYTANFTPPSATLDG